MPNRYDQLIDLVRQVKPRFIIEVGTHRAGRAVAMCRAALLASSTVHYIGYDVFETKDAAFHDAAMNGKGVAVHAQAAAALNQVRAEHPGFSWNLMVGDTRQTLHGKILGAADLAFIDGDHRLEAIRGDYAALARSYLIALDDYVTPGEQGELPDLDLFGCNRLADELGATILPAKDLCRPGWFAQIAVVRR